MTSASKADGEKQSKKNQMRTRAHWEQAGQPEGREKVLWLEAESELKGTSAASKAEEGSKDFIE